MIWGVKIAVSYTVVPTGTLMTARLPGKSFVAMREPFKKSLVAHNVELAAVRLLPAEVTKSPMFIVLM
jgi:hypothetical protein